uniref:fibronectin type III domain-containing protein n=1 Tax=Salmonella enterica TaxID=28901 RepID=UPI003297E696
TSKVAYGPTSAYEDGTVDDTTLRTSHSVALTGLTPESTYHFQVASTDGSGNAAAGDDGTFTTTAMPVESFVLSTGVVG